MSKRKYTLKQRARQQEDTRQRIVDAAMALHEEVGPRDTTISAIADRAGVQRLTVYRHFDDDLALFTACSGRWLELNPPPDPALWSGEDDPRRRSEAALGALYAYYRRTQGMLERVYRDRDQVPAVDEVMRPFDAFIDTLRRDLMKCWRGVGTPKSRARSATIGHCLQFSTWKSLAGEGLSDRRAARLAVRWIDAGR
jgi:AcrR family transcriptional regulator